MRESLESFLDSFTAAFRSPSQSQCPVVLDIPPPPPLKKHLWKTRYNCPITGMKYSIVNTISVLQIESFPITVNIIYGPILNIFLVLAPNSVQSVKARPWFLKSVKILSDDHQPPGSGVVEWRDDNPIVTFHTDFSRHWWLVWGEERIIELKYDQIMLKTVIIRDEMISLQLPGRKLS